MLGRAAGDPRLVPASLRVVDALAGLQYSDQLDAYLRGVMAGSDSPGLAAAAGLALVATMNRSGTEDLTAEAGELAALLLDRHGDERRRGVTVRQVLEQMVGSQELSIGRIAPEIKGTDADGVEFSLSDYRGKVVVLDFWADWCPHCREMYESEREMVKRLAGEPFVLLGINGDEADRARRVISAGTVTWRSWLDGPNGPIAGRYKIEAWPTVYVLDKDGRIRFEDLRGEDLEAAVKSLLGSPAADADDDLVAGGAEWRWRVATDAVDPRSWKTAPFDDSGWERGVTPFAGGPIPAATELDLGGPGERPTTVLFRRTFDLPAGRGEGPLVVSCRFIDGIAVHVNGREVFREALPAAADFTTPAVARAARPVNDPVSFLIDATAFQPAGNCIAVEVHSTSPYRARRLFDLSVRKPPDFGSRGGEGSEAGDVELISLLADVGVGLPGAGDALANWRKASSPLLRFRASLAGAMHDLPLTADEIRDGELLPQYARVLMANTPRLRERALREDLAGVEYVRLEQWTRMLGQIARHLPAQLKPLAEGVETVHGVTLYRSGRLEEARAAFEASLAERGPNPYDLAYLSLLDARAGDDTKARERRTASLKLFAEGRWKHGRWRNTVIEEMERAFAGR